MRTARADINYLDINDLVVATAGFDPPVKSLSLVVPVLGAGTGKIEAYGSRDITLNIWSDEIRRSTRHQDSLAVSMKCGFQSQCQHTAAPYRGFL